ncbi:MAG: nucleotidyltransferase family protein [Jiangellaceae bacterium]
MDFDVDLARLAEICDRYGVAELSVFGSAARGESRSERDIDVLYTLHPGARLGWKIEDLSDELSTLLGRPVDLVSKRALHPRLRDEVLADAWPIYEAA